MDPQWGHLTIKMAGHAPFGAQVILNGHEYVAVAAQAAGIGFIKEGNCFTGITDPAAWPRSQTPCRRMRLQGGWARSCDRWIYTACLVFGLDLADQQAQRVPLRLLGLPGRVQPQPALRLRRADGPDVFDTVGGPDPVPAGRAALGHLFGVKTRPRTARAVAAAGGRDRDTCV